MKQKIAALLVICMALQAPFSSLAANGGAKPFGSGIWGNSSLKPEVLASPNDADARDRDTGALRIQVRNFLGTKDSRFNVYLEPDEKTARKLDIPGELEEDFYTDWEDAYMGRSAGGEAVFETAEAVFEMTDIPEGKYRLTLTQDPDEAGAYLPFVQNKLEIKAKTVTTLNLANDYPEYYGYEGEEKSGSRKMGLLVPGNFSDSGEDGKLDEDDLEEIMEAIFEESQDPRFDLNGDGEVDLVDLECFAKFYKNGDRRAKAKAIENPLIREGDIIQAISGNREDDAVRQLFAGARGSDGEPALEAGPLNGGAIAGDNPVEISAEFRDPVEARGFAIVPHTGSLDVMVDGAVFFEDEDGNVYKALVKDGRQQGGVVKTAKGKAKSKGNPAKQKEKAPSPATGSSAEALIAIGEDEAPKSAFTANRKSVRGKSVATPSDIGEAASGEMAEFLANYSGGAALAAKREAKAPKDEEALQGKSILIDLGGQIAIKRVLIRIEKTLGSGMEGYGELAQISRVEFLNHMEDHIPEPDLSIPDKLKGEPGDAKFKVSWRRQANVTGYVVHAAGETMKGEKEFAFPAQEENFQEVASIDGGEVDNGKKYTVKVRSVNGDWRSEYSAPITVVPEAKSRPQPPQQIQITGGYRKLSVSWRKMKGTDSYSLYYREKGGAEAAFMEIHGVTGTSTEITGLKDEVTYELYMTATNALGTSGHSEMYEGKTRIVKAPETPDFYLLNVPKEGGGVSDVITGVQIEANSANQPCDEFAVVDGIFETAWVRTDWDAGCSYSNNDGNSPIVTFDQPYEMDTVVIIPDYEQPYGYSSCKVIYWDEDDARHIAEGRFTQKKDKDNLIYYEFQASEKFTAKKARVAVQTGHGGARRISYAELKFYKYHDLQERIYAMYTDDLHVELADGVDQDMIDGFKDELEIVDETCGEKTPQYDFLKQELENAEMILSLGKSSGKILKVNTKLAQKKDGHIAFRGGLNTWQPLGVAGLAGDKVAVYVGAKGKRLGDPASLTVVAAQYHGESNAVFTTAGTLRVGPNEIVIPKVGSMASAEQGGQLYVRYDGNYNEGEYAVRVNIPAAEAGKSSAAFIPSLDLSGVAGEERDGRLEAYVKELQEVDPEELHNQCHGAAGLAYDARNCVFGATDVAGDRAMHSLPASQILEGCGGSAQTLGTSLQAMDEMLYLFYQHKGLSDDPNAGEKNQMPVSRINIRYQRMFEGAFMYAGGAHIGIEYGSAPAMACGTPVVADEKGKYISGSYFGWGIGHEIGHEINEGAYAVAEVTNNYFPQLVKSRDSNETTRWQDYSRVYEKVNSGAKGPSPNGAVQLAMYWQLHLAYDRDYNFKVYEDYTEQLNGLFFARVDSYARNPASAPKPGGVALSLDGDKDNNLMRLGCAAAKKNILEFFERWGMEPDAKTLAYAGQFEKELRAIWLANDDQRVEVIERGDQPGGGSSIKVSGTLSYSESGSNGGNEVAIDLETDSGTDFFGYEVFRIERQGAKVVRRAVGFVTPEESGMVNRIATVNNRAFTYEVVGYDLWLRPTQAYTIGDVRVSHNGNLDVSKWGADTNMVSVGDDGADDMDEGPSDENPDAIVKNQVKRVVDGDNATTYRGKTKTGDPEILLYLNGQEVLTGLEYQLSEDGAPMGAFEVYMSQDGSTWQKASTQETSFTLTEGGNGVRRQKILFSVPAESGTGRELVAYEASIVKLVGPGQAGKEIAVSEIVLFGQTGDRLDLEKDGGIGKLAEPFVDASTNEVLIPQGSVVFTGTYKGNPAYNSLLLWDESGKIVGGSDNGDVAAEQLIFAPDPGTQDLTEISDGHWVYFIRPEHLTGTLPEKVRGELYRVDHAIGQKGQRLVSSTVFVEVPAMQDLPDIRLEGMGSLAAGTPADAGGDGEERGE